MSKIALTAHPKWVEDLEAYVKPAWERTLASPCVVGATKGTLAVEQMRGWILQLYPFIHAFPVFLAQALADVRDHELSRNFLIENIATEKEHARLWVEMGKGFGVTLEEMMELADGQTPCLRDVQALTDHVRAINYDSSIAVRIAATSYAIEGLAGDISRKVVNGFRLYREMPGVSMTDATYKWMRMHAHYDDEHPKVALECVKHYATTPAVQRRCMIAAKRSLQLLDLALDTSMKAYAPAETNGKHSTTPDNKRRVDRRSKATSVNFPDRRFRDRRGMRYEIAV